MAKQQISLNITFQASYLGDDPDVPDSTTVEENLTLIIPAIEEKYVVLPKVLEGITTQVIEVHRKRVMAYRDQKSMRDMRPSLIP